MHRGWDRGIPHLGTQVHYCSEAFGPNERLWLVNNLGNEVATS